jgi:hypothetical protein
MNATGLVVSVGELAMELIAAPQSLTARSAVGFG